MLKTLSKSIRQYKRATILAPIFMVIEIVMEVMIPFLMSLLIDKGIDVGDMSYIIKIGTLLVATAIVSLGVGALCGTLSARASSGFASNLRQDIYGKIMGFSFKNTNKFSSASLVTRVTTDVTNVQNAYQMLIRQAVRSPVMLVTTLIMAFTINPSISLIYLAVIPVLGIGLFFVIYKVFPLFQRVLVKYDRLNKVVQENLKGIRVVKSYVREDEEKQKFEEISTDIYNTHSKASKRVAFNAPLMQFCVYACMLLIAWIGARLVVGGSMSTGQLMSFFTYTMYILMSLMLLSMVAVSLLISRASAVRIAEVLNEQPDIANPQNPITTIKDGSIAFSDVSFSYVGVSDKLCLMDIDLEIKSGEVIGIIGGTGSSKTTLVQLIPRLYDTTGGVVSVGGIDVREYDIETLRDSVAVVLQKNVLFSGTINENLRWGNPDATDEEIRYACQLAQAHNFIQSFPKGYETHIEQGGANISGGQKQRLCIARALLKKPKILILDDSTSAVDTSTESLIRKALRTELPQTTKIIIAQRVTSVQDSDKIIVMEGGRINGIGTHIELINNNEIYKEVFKTQESGGDFDEQ